MLSKSMERILHSEASHRYAMLDRMRSDCEYFLGNGNRYSENLWARGDVQQHIENMKVLWNSFPEEGKPEWLPWEKILEYEKQMVTDGYAAFQTQIQKLNKDTDPDRIYQSQDFQCDQTGGFPAMLCVNWEKGKAWLELVEHMGTEEQIRKYGLGCAAWHFWPCSSPATFNNLLRSLGEDAVSNAELPEDDEYE